MGIPKIFSMSTTASGQPTDKLDFDDPKVEQVQVEETQNCISWTVEEEKKLVRRVDLFLLPTIWLMYLLSYMDRTNIGNAKIAGMADDLNLDSSKYSVALVVFFIGYVIFEAPSNMVLVRSRPSRYLPAIMVVWGGLTCCMAAIQSYHHLIILRVFVGILESGFAPGILLIISSWYKREEQSKRFAVFISAAILSGAFGGLLAGAITGGLEGAGGLRGWRWLFIVEGVATIVWAGVSSFILLDFPATSHRLTEREREIAVTRLREGGVTVRSEDGPKYSKAKSFLLALKEWKTWGFVLGYMVIVGSSTLSYFYPTLVHNLGYTSMVQAQYMTVPIYAVAFVCTAVTGYFCDFIPGFRGLVIGSWLSFSLITSILVCVLHNFTARYALLVLMAAGLWSSNALSLSFASSAFGSMEPEVRAIALAVVNAMGNLAQIYGAYLFPSGDSPQYVMGFGVISGLLAFGVVVYVVMHILLRKQNA